MRSFDSWHDLLRGVRTFAEVLEKANLVSDFAAVQENQPEFARLASWAIEQLLRSSDDGEGGTDGGGGKPTPSAIVNTIKKSNQRARQFRLNLTPDDALSTQEEEHLLKELEKIIEILTGCTGDYVFFNDREVGDVTLRGAVYDLRLWDQVIDALVEMADTARMHDEFALKAVRIAREIARRRKK